MTNPISDWLVTWITADNEHFIPSRILQFSIKLELESDTSRFPSIVCIFRKAVTHFALYYLCNYPLQLGIYSSVVQLDGKLSWSKIETGIIRDSIDPELSAVLKKYLDRTNTNTNCLCL